MRLNVRFEITEMLNVEQQVNGLNSQNVEYTEKKKKLNAKWKTF